VAAVVGGGDRHAIEVGYDGRGRDAFRRQRRLRRAYCQGNQVVDQVTAGP